MAARCACGWPGYSAAWLVTLVERGPLCHHTPQGYVVDLAPSVASRLYDRYASEPTFTPLGRRSLVAA